MKYAELSLYQQGLLRRALQPAATSAQMLLRTQAVDEAVRNGDPLPWDEVRVALEEAASDVFGTWQSARAARMAVRLLGILNGDVEEVSLSDHPERMVTLAYWPGPAGPFAELDGRDSEGLRDAWRTRLQGPPPWPA